jgi:hypothetical protein
MPLLALTDAQLAQVQAAAALLRVSERSAFLCALVRRFNRQPPTDIEVARAIEAALGVLPLPTFVCASHKPDSGGV